MVCGSLLSIRVKSCCSRPLTGGPDFRVTTTSRYIGLPPGFDRGLCCGFESAAVDSKARRKTKPLRLAMCMGSSIQAKVGVPAGALADFDALKNRCQSRSTGTTEIQRESSNSAAPGVTGDSPNCGACRNL